MVETRASTHKAVPQVFALVSYFFRCCDKGQEEKHFKEAKVYSGLAIV